jgi:hypothetical protein
MRRTTFMVLLIGSMTLAAVVLQWPESAGQHPKDQPPSGGSTLANSESPRLPVTKVALFSSGVGYFQREGQVQGDARVDLSFPAADVNDLLKSLVLQDLGGGRITAVSYESQDPVDKALQSFALDLRKNPTFGELLNQARGEKVEVGWREQGVQLTLTGTIVGVERQRQPAGKETFVETELLNVHTAEGLRSLPLSQVQRVRLLNPSVDGDLKRALEVLASAHDTRKRTVSLSFAGEGKRPVRVGYVIENPIWKTSYRLVLDQESKPRLQGWAVVENVTDEDWNGVRVTLVAGRPISFLMDLYQPLHVPRPVVEPELFASLRPPTYTGPLDTRAAFAREDEKAKKAADKAPAPAPPRERNLDLEKGVAPAATATELGDYFQYAIEQPVHLGRQKSALLPIVSGEVGGERVSIFSEKIHAKHPLLGLKLKNATGLHLTQGPITVFEGGSYAGDARIPDLQPNEERLLSYAVDLGTEVEPSAKSAPDHLVAVKIVKGILYATHKLHAVKTYNVKNRSEHDRVLLIEHPVRPDWKLVSPAEPEERSRDVYRFRLAAAAGKSASLEVSEEQDRVSQVILSTADDQTIRLYLTSTVTSQKAKEALEQAVALKVKLAETRAEIAQVERQLRDIAEDQARLRANMERVPQTSAAYQRYLKKFDEQETEIEKLQEQVRRLQRTEQEQRKAYEAYLLGLDVK